MSLEDEEIVELWTDPDTGGRLQYGQGIIVKWDPDNLENTIRWGNALLHNLPILGFTDSLTYREGGSVGLLGWVPGSGERRGLGVWWIVGQFVIPGGSEDLERFVHRTFIAETINTDVLNAEDINIGGEDLESYIKSLITEQVPESDPDPPPVGEGKIKLTYDADWTANYLGGGSKNTFNEKPHQGFFSNTNGNQRGLIGFPSSQIQSDHGARTITKVRVYMYFEHWYNNSGGTAIIGHHGHNSAPGQFSATTDVVRSSGWPKPGGRWVSYSNAMQEWGSGVKRGISIGPGPSNSKLYYGRIASAGSSRRPKIEITSTG